MEHVQEIFKPYVLECANSSRYYTVMSSSPTKYTIMHKHKVATILYNANNY